MRRYTKGSSSARICLLFVCLLLVSSPRAVMAEEGDGAREFVVAALQTQLRWWVSADDFAQHMASRVEAAMVHRPDLLVFPEDLGTPLVALGDLEALEKARSLPEAIQGVAARHAEEVAAVVAQHKVSIQRALWLIKSDVIMRTYVETFSDLARRHKVFIAAGSTPMVFADKAGDAFNTACVFDPEGQMQVVGRKVHLVNIEQAEGLDLSPGTIESYKVFQTPKAVVGCIICADGWDPEIAKALVKQGAQVLLQVSANPEVWSAGTREGWKNSLFSRVQELKRWGVCVMGVGNLLGLPFQGQSALVGPKEWTPDGSGFLVEATSPTEEEVVVGTLDLSRVGGEQ